MDNQAKSGTIFLISYEIKVLILGLTAIILALAAGFFLDGLLYGSFADGPDAAVFWVLAAIVFLFLVVAWNIAALLIKINVVYLIFAVSALALIFPFIARANVWQWLAAGILFLFLVFARWRISADLDLLVKPKFARIMARGVKKTLSGLVIFVVVFYFFSPKIQQAENLFFSRSLFETVSVSLEKVIQGFLPQFKKDMTVDEAIIEIAAEAAFEEALKKEPRLKEAPELENIRNQFFEEFKKQLPKQRREISEQLGIVLQGDEKITDVLYDFTLVKFRELPAEAKGFFNVFAALTLYFILRIAAIPFGWLALAAGAGLFKILLMVGFVSVKRQTMEREFAEM